MMDRKQRLKKYLENESFNESGGLSSSFEDDQQQQQSPTTESSLLFNSNKLKRKSSENLSDSEPESSSSSPATKKIATANQTVVARPSSFSNGDNSVVAEANVNISKRKVEASVAIASVGGGGDFAAKMMKKMGYETGQGLGRAGQGITKPIDESNQKGKHGLGYAKKNFEKKVEEWDLENDPVSAYETPEWLENTSVAIAEPEFTIDQLMSWKKIGIKKRILDDENQFCSAEIVRQVLDCKSIFDDLDNKDMMNARSRSNPFESIGAAFFQNRAALKMANIDAVFNFMFTDPKDFDGKSKIRDDEPLYFCDVCAGPGGFSEYVLWRKKWAAKGFGMTLKDSNDFKLDEFLAGSAEYFEPFYGQHGIDGDGDVTKKENLIEFRNFVLKQTNNEGVHMFMADGGFSVEGNENIQEILSKQIYLCQFLCAMSVLREGGNFVCKLFDIFTPFSVGLIYLAYKCFDRIAIHKPVTSRPANSERYIICEGARPSKTAVIVDYLFSVNDDLNRTFANCGNDRDVNVLVPLDVLKEDASFFNYVVNSNESFGKAQVFNLRKVQAFATNSSLYDPRQAQLIEDCLRYWNIPDNVKRFEFTGDRNHLDYARKNKRLKYRCKFVPFEFNQVISYFNEQLRQTVASMDLNSIAMQKLKTVDTPHSFEENFKKSSLFDFKCMISSGTLVLLASCGRKCIYEMRIKSDLVSGAGGDSVENNSGGGGGGGEFYSWKKLNTEIYNIELPKMTLLLAEKCVEYRGVEKAQQHSNAIHLLDALFIDGVNMVAANDLTNEVASIEERVAKLKVFCSAITKNSVKNFTTVRVKELVKLIDVQRDILDRVVERKCKSSNSRKNLSIQLQAATSSSSSSSASSSDNSSNSSSSSSYVYVNGIYFFKHIQSPWSVVFSRSSGRFYYYNSATSKSTFDFPSDAPRFFADPKSYMECGFVWVWSNEAEILNNNHHQTQTTAAESSSSSSSTAKSSAQTLTKEKFLSVIAKYNNYNLN